MKVLFAVSNEEISESIVKKYQKEYKQIISYKNVYYFNAILKELQKEKTYDRIVISEDLEAFTNTQYDQIDKFIFEKLDSISDEASNVRGNDIPIILICSDRREKGEEILVKLFGIGIYNAIIGNDRSVDEVCKLIHRPRVKKEAKAYYKIDAEDVNYQVENENDVSEMEIQNIVAHYRKLGKNEDRFVDSFNNIAAQYNDTQLRIISKFLPLNVRAVLEERSVKYQQIMSFNNRVSDTIRIEKEEAKGPSETLLKPMDRETILERPVIIPSAVNINTSKKLSKQKKEEPKKYEPDEMYDVESYDKSEEDEVVEETSFEEETPTVGEPKEIEKIEEIVEEAKIEPVEPVKKRRGRPRKNPLPEVEKVEVAGETETTGVVPVKRRRGRPRKNPLPEVEIVEEIPVLPGVEETPEENEDTFLPGFEEVPEENEDAFLPGFEEKTEENEDAFLPGFEEEPEENGDAFLSGFEEEQEENEDDFLPGFDEKTEINIETKSDNYYDYRDSSVNTKKEDKYVNTIDLTRLLTPDKKIVTFVGTSKNGTSFMVNNIAELMSSMGVNTAILDTTKNRNAYYIYTKNEEDLRITATHSIEGLAQGVAQGVRVNNNLTVYTSLPNENEDIRKVDEVLETLIKNHSLILIDTDFETPVGYFKQSQETYLVQTLDILTIQPLTAFLKELKSKNILDENKLRIILNKVVKLRGVTEKVIIGGIAYYNDPAMSFMTELFDRNTIKYVSVPFEDETYIRYLENVIECNISLKGYSKGFMQTLKELANMIYPRVVTSKNGNYQPPSAGNNRNSFTPNMNNTLEQMKRKF